MLHLLAVSGKEQILQLDRAAECVNDFETRTIRI
jgi:hypothetical protein